MIRLQFIMFLLFMFLSHVLGTPTDEFGEFTKIADGDILPNEDKLLMNIVPGYASDIAKQSEAKKKNYIPDLDGIDMDNEIVTNFNNWVEKGITKRGLTFNIYNDDMRQAAVALFKLFQFLEGENFTNLKKWAEQNINTEMCLYALRLASLYGSNIAENHLLPPFIMNPRYFVNAETISKVFTILDDMRERGQIDSEMANVDQYDYMFSTNKLPRQFITINSNYSGWTKPMNGIDEEINYFREDVGLNSYYLGLHLLHPFWMSHEELDQNFPRHAEHHYYAHQQLMARYLLEKEHLQQKKYPTTTQDGSDYIPNLIYRNGLPFPTRSCDKGQWDEEKKMIIGSDIAIKECIQRGFIYMENGTTINLTEESYVEMLSRLIRANLDGIRTAKVVRAVFGYGTNRFQIDEYNPAPSLLHHPETSLRDPVYWSLIKYMLNYFTEYKNIMEPYDLTAYETEDIKIIDEDNKILNLTTYFHSYKFTLEYARNIYVKDADDHHTFLSVRQKRLKHEPFEIKFALEASSKTMAVVRIYLGPQCGSDCWQNYSRFFELDTYLVELQEGLNQNVMSSKFSRKHSDDSLFDTVLLKPALTRKSTLYSIFKFPESLLVPRGLENGLNLTLFMMVTPVDEDWVQPINNFNYRRAVKLDSKPLGFPFHRPAAGFKERASNYRFYNITVYHKRFPDETSNTFFSPNLY